MVASAFVRIFVFALILILPKIAWGAPIVFSGSGANAAAIQATVDNFRAAVGNPNNGNAPGPLAGGRREINWDGGGTATTPGGTPFTVFLTNRGALITTPGTGFVQAPPTGGPGGGLATVFNNATYGTIFTTFSSPRLFSASGSNITDVDFFVPGGGGFSALTNGFGVVFADVDLANTTSIEYFDKTGASLAKLFAATADNGLSFLGAVFSEGLILDHVRIITGNIPLGPSANDGGGVDVVAMDDFIFGEPVPEPSAFALLWIGLGGSVAIHRRRKKV